MTSTASDVLEMLRRHYLPEGRPPGWLFMPEIGSPDGRRRADLLTVPTHLAGSRLDTLVGHEIKVSRSDVLAELADPTKADPWLQYCTRWWLVVSDPSLVEGLEIPELWGVMAPPSGRRTRSMTVLKPAPRLDPAGDVSPALLRISAFVVNRVEVDVRRAQRELQAAELRRDHAERTLQELRDAGALTDAVAADRARKVHRILALVDAHRHDISGLYLPDVDEELVAQAVLDHARTQEATVQARRTLERLIESIRRASVPLDRVVERLEQIRDDGPAAAA